MIGASLLTMATNDKKSPRRSSGGGQSGRSSAGKAGSGRRSSPSTGAKAQGEKRRSSAAGSSRGAGKTQAGGGRSSGSGKGRGADGGKARGTSDGRSHKGAGGHRRSSGQSTTGGQPGRGKRASGSPDVDGRKPRSGARRDDRRDGRQSTGRDEVTPRGDFVFKGHELPKWVKEELRRTAKRGAGDAAIVALTKAAAHFAAGRHSQALSEARNAKRHAPQSPTIMETIGISAYRSELWDEALRELKAFRRRTGEGTHLAIEMDILRALGRDADVEKTFALVRTGEMDAAARSEAKVVYASYLLDHGRPREAWAVAKPGKMGESPSEAALRQWYVAARAAVGAGDIETAIKIGQRIRKHDAAFPGLELLDEEIAASGNTTT